MSLSIPAFVWPSLAAMLRHAAHRLAQYREGIHEEADLGRHDCGGVAGRCRGAGGRTELGVRAGVQAKAEDAGGRHSLR